MQKMILSCRESESAFQVAIEPIGNSWKVESGSNLLLQAIKTEEDFLWHIEKWDNGDIQVWLEGKYDMVSVFIDGTPAGDEFTGPTI